MAEDKAKFDVSPVHELHQNMGYIDTGNEQELKNYISKLAGLVKQLNCIYEISNVLSMVQVSVEEALTEVVDLIPLGWPVPGETYVRLKFDTKTFVCRTFKEIGRREDAEIRLSGAKAGSIEVFHGNGEDNPDNLFDAFSHEKEKNLLQEISRRIEKFILNKQFEKKILQSEEKSRINSNVESVLSSILWISMEHISLKEQLKKALDMILSLPWLSLQSRGCIFLRDKNNDNLVMIADRGITVRQKEMCRLVPVGKCTCGKAALEKEIVFCDSLNDYHQAVYEGIQNPGHYWHYCVPITSGDRVLGIICLYMNENRDRNQLKEALLYAFANVLAGMIERKYAEETLVKSETRLAEAERIARLGSWEWNIKENFIFWSDEVYRILGVQNNYASTYENFIKCVHPDDKALVAESVNAAKSHEKPFNLDFRIVLPDGSHRIVHVQAEVTHGEEGDSTVILGTIQDINERRKREKELQRLSNYDEATGVLNRSRFISLMDELMAYVSKNKMMGALMLVNIDEFKLINDTYGHTVGDEFLNRVAGLIHYILNSTPALQDSIHKSIIGRISEKEFTVFIPTILRKTAIDIAEKIRNGIETFRFTENKIRATACIGIVLYPEHGVTTSDLLRKGDAAIQRAKELGRNRCHVYRDDDRNLENIHSRMREKERILNALEDDRFVPWFQPILCLGDGKIHHYEALARMRAEDGGIVLPSEFIRAAETFGLIGGIDRVITAKTMAFMSSLSGSGSHYSFGMNLSGKSLGDEELMRYLQTKIIDLGIEPGRIIFEITETAAIHDMKRAIRFIEALKEMGCLFALDDFGVGFTSFVYLRELKVDYIKIDGSFVKKLSTSPQDQLVVKAIAGVADGLGIKKVAEFVEDEQTLEMLRNFGIDYAQGYLIGRPSPTLIS
ncbi:MAG: EAL domain-containing protein [Nitrospirae bacterium]|nr:EAL domain-containing protein [Nitrospirota bacterium]